VINRDWVQPWERIPTPLSWQAKLALSFLVGVVIYLLMQDSQAATVSTQSKEPWSLSQCDKKAGKKVIAVFNQSTWNRSGYPLWRVVCVY
jgi:uncharacterized protein (UPF0333 family)